MTMHTVDNLSCHFASTIIAVWYTRKRKKAGFHSPQTIHSMNTTASLSAGTSQQFPTFSAISCLCNRPQTTKHKDVNITALCLAYSYPGLGSVRSTPTISLGTFSSILINPVSRNGYFDTSTTSPSFTSPKRNLKSTYCSSDCKTNKPTSMIRLKMWTLMTTWKLPTTQ